MWLEGLLIWSPDTIWLGIGLEEGIDARYLTSLLLHGHVLPPPPFLPLPSTTSNVAAMEGEDLSFPQDTNTVHLCDNSILKFHCEIY